VSRVKTHDVVVIGAGPAGYVAAIRCAQLGLDTACVEKWQDDKGEPVLGGTCLNVGCIPSKVLLESSEDFAHLGERMGSRGILVEGARLELSQMMSHKDGIVKQLTGGVRQLFKANGITLYSGRGRLLDGRQVEVRGESKREPLIVGAGNVILATGSVPMAIDSAPLDGDRIVDSTGALSFGEVPKRLGIISAGVIGLEMGSVWRRLGSEVVLVEAQTAFLPPVDEEIARDARRQFTAQGLDMRLGAMVRSARSDGKGVDVTYLAEGEEHTERFDRLVVAVGRRPYTDDLFAPEAGVLLDERGFIDVDEQWRTSVPGVYAIGDAVRGPMLAHKGSEEGVAVAETIAGGKGRVNYNTIPWVIYTDPELAWVGRTEQELKGLGEPYRTGVFPFAVNGRALALGSATGKVKIVADGATDRIRGVHIIGAKASELIAEAVVAMEFGASSEDLARTVHAHPTLSEALHEAALAVDGRPIHIAPRKKKS